MQSGFDPTRTVLQNVHSFRTDINYKFISLIGKWIILCVCMASPIMGSSGFSMQYVTSVV